MNTRVLTIVFSALAISAAPLSVQAIGYHWGHIYGDANDQTVTSVAMDNDGNVFLTGSYNGSVDFGGGPITYNGPHQGTFLAKISPMGAEVFSLALDDSLDYATNRLGTDGLGNVYLANDFRSTVDMGGGSIIAKGFRDGVLAKFDPQGNHLWSIGIGSVDAQVLLETAKTSVAGQTAISGTFTGAVDFGGTILTANPFKQNLFVAMYTNQGVLVWARHYMGSLVLVTSLSVDVTGNTVIAGYHSGSFDFGGGNFTTSGYNVFLARYDVSGNHLWSKSLGADGTFEYAFDVATDVLGNIAITGHFSQPFDLGGGQLTSAGGWDMYVAKFDPNGNHLWSESFGDQNEQRGYTVAMDGLGEIIVGGHFFGAVDFGGIPLVGDPIDYFAARFSTSGTHLWSQRFDVNNIGLPSTKPYSIAAAANLTGRMAFVGSFKDAVNFGGGNLTGAGGWDTFATAFGETVTGIPGIASGESYLRAHPNPFNPRTTISYSVARTGPIQLEIYDVRGRRVRVLADGWRPVGEHSSSWDGLDDRGQPVASGVYFTRLQSVGQKSLTQRVVLLK